MVENELNIDTVKKESDYLSKSEQYSDIFLHCVIQINTSPKEGNR